MADWLKRVVEEVDQEFKDLPAWKKGSSEGAANSVKEEPPPATIREPRPENNKE